MFNLPLFIFGREGDLDGARGARLWFRSCIFKRR